MINYVFARYQQRRVVKERRRGDRGGWAESFIIISEEECCYSCGKMWCGATRIHLGNEPAMYTSAHRPISRTIDGADKQEDLFLAFREGVRVESKSPAHVLRKITRGEIFLVKSKVQ